MKNTEIIKSILEKIHKKISINSPNSLETTIFPENGYKVLPLSANNLIKITPSITSSKIAFIDGGNTEIIGSSDFSLQLIRTAFVIFKNNKKLHSGINEFFILITAENNNGNIFFNSEFFSLRGDVLINKEDLSINSLDSTIKDGNNRAEISKVGNIARRFSELALAKNIADDLDENDAIILDGSLKSTIRNEEIYLQNLFEKITKNNVILCSLPKTARIFSSNGNSMISILENLSKNIEAPWLYYPVAEINLNSHQAELSFAKLNKYSRFIFSFEIFKSQKSFLKSILEQIAENSKDSAFPGYPYGLIAADKLARITNNEKDYLSSLFKSKSSIPQNILDSLKVHEILDNLSF